MWICHCWVLLHSSNKNEHYLVSANCPQKPLSHQSRNQKTWHNYGFRYPVIESIFIFKMKEHCPWNANNLSQANVAVFDRALRNILLTFGLTNYSLWHLEPLYSILFTVSPIDKGPLLCLMTLWCLSPLVLLLGLQSFQFCPKVFPHSGHFTMLSVFLQSFQQTAIYSASSWWLKMNQLIKKQKNPMFPFIFRCTFSIFIFNCAAWFCRHYFSEVS